MNERSAKCCVIHPHRSSNPDPIKLKPGARVQVGKRDDEWPAWLWCTSEDGKSSWVPEALLEISGQEATAQGDYDATELTANEGDELLIIDETGGWLWCRNAHGEYGWIPESNVERIM